MVHEAVARQLSVYQGRAREQNTMCVQGRTKERRVQGLQPLNVRIQRARDGRHPT